MICHIKNRNYYARQMLEMNDEFISIVVMKLIPKI